MIAGQCGDVGLSPGEVPFLCLQALRFGHGQSAHIPKRGMGDFVDRVVGCLAAHGGETHYEAPVTRILRNGARVTRVETPRGLFTAETVISNIDPARARGFGRFNVWSYPDEDLDTALDRSRVGLAAVIGSVSLLPGSLGGFDAVASGVLLVFGRPRRVYRPLPPHPRPEVACGGRSAPWKQFRVG